MIVASDSRGQFKLQKQSEFERQIQKKQEIESGQRERLVQLRKKRDSMTIEHTPFTSLPFLDADQHSESGGGREVRHSGDI